jgi:hypothetical protein
VIDTRESGPTLLGCHHFPADQLLEGIVASDVQSESFHETLLGNLAAVQLEHEEATEMTHRGFNLRVLLGKHERMACETWHFNSTIAVGNVCSGTRRFTERVGFAKHLCCFRPVPLSDLGEIVQKREISAGIAMPGRTKHCAAKYLHATLISTNLETPSINSSGISIMPPGPIGSLSHALPLPL